MPSSRRGCLSPPPSLEHSRCFDSDTKGADGAADLLEVLGHSPLQKLHFGRCSQIPSTAWQKLRGASWSNLKEADFDSCLVLQIWLRCLASSLRCRAFFPMLRAIVTAVSLTAFLATLTGQKCEIDSCKWSDLQKSPASLQEERQQIAILLSPPAPFDHSRCFDDDTKGADGAADLLEVLGNSPVEMLNFQGCSQIPSTAWQKLRGASWSNLREANFYACLVLFANLVAMFGQFVETPCFFSYVKGLCHSCFFDSIWQHWQAKNVK